MIQKFPQKIFELVNEERVKEGHAAMIWDTKHCYPRSVAAAGYHIMRSITETGYGTSDNLARHGGRQNGCGGGISLRTQMILRSGSLTFGCHRQVIKQIRWMITMLMAQLQLCIVSRRSTMVRRL